MASIEKRVNTWRVVWWDHGKRQAETFATEAGAVEFRGYVEAAKNNWPRGWVKGQGWADDLPSTSPTFETWALEAIANRRHANERTKADYRRDLRNHVFPYLGATPVDRITDKAVDDWHRALATPKPDGPGLSIKTLTNIHGMVSSVIADAMTHRPPLTDHNPFAGALRVAASVKVEDMVFLTPGEFESIAARMSDPYLSLARLLAGTGMRFGEATALRVADVDLLSRRPTARVVRAWKRQPDGYYVIGEPKSVRSRRTITLSAELVELLVPFVSGRASDDLLIEAVHGGQMLNSTFHDTGWAPAVARARVCDRHYAEQKARNGKMPRMPVACGCPGLLTKRPTVHSLRHTHASWLIEAGVAPLAISRRLGHKSIVTTFDRYGHLMPEQDQQVNSAVDRALARR